MGINKKFKFFVIKLSRLTLILITVFSAITMAFIMNFLQSYLWWGFISTDLLIIGTFDALVIAFILAPIIIISVGNLTSLEKEIASRKIIEKSERRYRLIAENVNDVVWVMDAETEKIIYISPSVYRQRGFTFQEVLNQSLDQVLSAESLEKVREILAEQISCFHLKRKSQNTVLELQQLHKNGSQHWVEIDAHLIENEGTGRLEVIGVTREISLRKLDEIELKNYREHLEELVKIRTEELKKANDELTSRIEREEELKLILQDALSKEKELSELKSRFISTTSHEFRTPLTSVLTSSGLLQRYADKWSEDKKDEHFEKIKNSISYLVTLLDDILTISQTESGKINYEPTQINFYKLVHDCVSDAENLSTSHNIKINYDTDENEYVLDQKLMRFIVSNLLSNAVKYSAKGKNVKLDVFSKEDNLHIEIKDEGIGISEEEIDRIFDSFYRAKNVEDVKGSGLGLAIVKRAVDLHGGKIKVNSELNKGTTFTVMIPLNKF